LQRSAAIGHNPNRGDLPDADIFPGLISTLGSPSGANAGTPTGRMRISEWAFGLRAPRSHAAAASMKFSDFWLVTVL
jgi:hypothetical protein